MLKYSASNQAASAIYLVNKIFDMQNSWTAELESQSGYDSNELKVCARDLWALLERANEFQEKHIKQTTELDLTEAEQTSMLVSWYEEETKKLQAMDQEVSDTDLDLELDAKKRVMEKNMKEFRQAVAANNKNLVAVIKKFSLPQFHEAAKILYHVHQK